MVRWLSGRKLRFNQMAFGYNIHFFIIHYGNTLNTLTKSIEFDNLFIKEFVIISKKKKALGLNNPIWHL